MAVIAWQLLMLAAYANYLMLDWNAVPFAATHNPAQRHLLQSVVFHSAEFAPFVFGGATMIGAALPDLPLAIAWTVFLVFAVCWLRRQRLSGRGDAGLDFAEPDPAALATLELR